MDETPSPELVEYRNWLIAAEQKSQEDYDKTVLTLSGGALGISFAFIKDVVGSQPLLHSGLLWGAWFVWGLSVTSVLASFYLSRLALRKTILQIDKNEIYHTSPGGYYTTATTCLNFAGGFFFLIGLILIVAFAAYNMR